MIDLVNTIPPEAVLPTCEEIDLKIKEKYPGLSNALDGDSLGWRQEIDEIRNAEIEPVLKLFPELKKVIMDIPYFVNYKAYGDGLHWRYKAFLKYRKLLTKVANQAMIYSKVGGFIPYAWGGKIKPEYANESIHLELSDITNEPLVFLTARDGKFVFLTSVFIQALEGNEINRLRICPICSRIFWAYRKTSFGCSKKHSTAIRTRNYRANKSEREQNLDNHFKPRKKDNGTL